MDNPAPPSSLMSQGGSAVSLDGLESQDELSMPSETGQDTHTPGQDTHTPVEASPEHLPADLAASANKRFRLHEHILQLPECISILVVGLAGAGKSSFVNSAIRGVLKRTGQWARAGGTFREDRPNVTTVLQPLNIYFPNKGDEDEDCMDAPDAGLIRQSQAPRFIDVCGLPNENSESVRTLLRLLLYGHLPLGTNLLDVLADASRDANTNSVLRAYPTGDRQLAIHRVIFVTAANTDLPMDLIKAVMDVAQPPSHKPGRDNIVSKRAVPVFGLMTKRDMIPAGDRQELELRKQRFIESCLLGVESNFTLCQNYVCQEGEVNDPGIDGLLLGFLGNVCDPSHHVDNPTWKLKADEGLESHVGTWALVVLFMAIVLAFVLFGYTASAPPPPPKHWLEQFMSDLLKQ